VLLDIVRKEVEFIVDGTYDVLLINPINTELVFGEMIRKMNAQNIRTYVVIGRACFQCNAHGTIMKTIMEMSLSFFLSCSSTFKRKQKRKLNIEKG
jgi:hypothetical protein